MFHSNWNRTFTVSILLFLLIDLTWGNVGSHLIKKIEEQFEFFTHMLS